MSEFRDGDPQAQARQPRSARRRARTEEPSAAFPPEAPPEADKPSWGGEEADDAFAPIPAQPTRPAKRTAPESRRAETPGRSAGGAFPRRFDPETEALERETFEDEGLPKKSHRPALPAGRSQGGVQRYGAPRVHTVPPPAAPRSRLPGGAFRPGPTYRTPPVSPPREEYTWEDTSTHLRVTEQRTFFKRQPVFFWVAVAVLLAGFLVVVGVIGVNSWKEAEAVRLEEARLQQLAQEKAQYKFLYRELVEQYSAEYGLDPAYIAAVIYNESRFQPEAVSHLGARGLMQIMEETGQWIAESLGEAGQYTQDQLFDPETSIRYGTWYMAFLHRMFDGDMVKMTAGYHAGQNRVAQWLSNPEYSKDGVRLSSIPIPETEQYVRKVVAAYDIYIKHYYTPEEESL